MPGNISINPEGIQCRSNFELPNGCFQLQDHAYPLTNLGTLTKEPLEALKTQFESSQSCDAKKSPNQELNSHHIKRIHTETTPTCKKVVAVVLGLLSLVRPAACYMQPTTSSIVQPQPNHPFNWTAASSLPFLPEFSPICTAFDPTEAPTQPAATISLPPSQFKFFTTPRSNSFLHTEDLSFLFKKITKKITHIFSSHFLRLLTSNFNHMILTAKRQFYCFLDRSPCKLPLKEWDMKEYTYENAKKIFKVLRVSLAPISDKKLENIIIRLVASYLLNYHRKITTEKTEVSVSFEEDMCHVTILEVYYNCIQTGGFSFKANLSDLNDILKDSAKFQYFFEESWITLFF